MNEELQPNSEFLEDAMKSIPVEPLDPVMVAEVLEALALRQEAVERSIDSLSRRLGATPKEGPWAWRRLGPAARQALLMQLREFVDWLVARYDLRGEAQTIPPCWYRHPLAVEELTALMVAWHAAYSQDQAAPSDALINWHDRWLWPTLHRLNIQLVVWRRCTTGTHEPARPAPALTDTIDFDTFLDEDLTPAPSPPDLQRGLSPEAVQALLERGDAEALLRDEPGSPIRYRGQWLAIHDNDPTGLWGLVNDERSHQLDTMHERVQRSETAGTPR